MVHKVKLKELRSIQVTKETKDSKGWTIPKGTVLHVMKELPPHPTLKYRLLVVRVDNGTGMLDLMPETVVRSDEVE